jgi:hypothetical protein
LAQSTERLKQDKNNKKYKKGICAIALWKTKPESGYPAKRFSK